MCDPFAMNGIFTLLTERERTAVMAKNTGVEQRILQPLFNELTPFRGGTGLMKRISSFFKRGIKCPLALVLTKSDYLERIDPDSKLGKELEGFDRDLLFTNWGLSKKFEEQRSLKHSAEVEKFFGKYSDIPKKVRGCVERYRYFMISANGGNLKDGVSVVNARPVNIEKPLTWLLSEMGIISKEM